MFSLRLGVKFVDRVNNPSFKNNISALCLFDTTFVHFFFVKFSFVRAPVSILKLYSSCQAADVRSANWAAAAVAVLHSAQSYHNVPYPIGILGIVIYASPLIFTSTEKPRCLWMLYVPTNTKIQIQLVTGNPMVCFVLLNPRRPRGFLAIAPEPFAIES